MVSGFLLRASSRSRSRRLSVVVVPVLIHEVGVRLGPRVGGLARGSAAAGRCSGPCGQLRQRLVGRLDPYRRPGGSGGPAGCAGSAAALLPLHRLGISPQLRLEVQLLLVVLRGQSAPARLVLRQETLHALPAGSGASGRTVLRVGVLQRLVAGSAGGCRGVDAAGGGRGQLAGLAGGGRLGLLLLLRRLGLHLPQLLGPVPTAVDPPGLLQRDLLQALGPIALLLVGPPVRVRATLPVLGVRGPASRPLSVRLGVVRVVAVAVVCRGRPRPRDEPVQAGSGGAAHGARPALAVVIPLPVPLTVPLIPRERLALAYRGHRGVAGARGRGGRGPSGLATVAQALEPHALLLLLALLARSSPPVCFVCLVHVVVVRLQILPAVPLRRGVQGLRHREGAVVVAVAGKQRRRSLVVCCGAGRHVTGFAISRCTQELLPGDGQEDFRSLG
mmetsp:Transcript_28658/g.40859  ORF Transcript_28658/g.40859 Transcript_28658/m.40859 type:complete len:445 (-) Transcript_28658:449-1783(-)